MAHAWHTRTMKLDEIDRTKLLPRSGIGVVAPWLVIMPPANPSIRIDLRMLDGVRAGAADDQDESDDQDHNAFVLVDNTPVRLRGEYLQVGPFAYRLSEVREYALRGANIPLGNGGLLQAATALLVVAASERDAPGSVHERQD